MENSQIHCVRMLNVLSLLGVTRTATSKAVGLNTAHLAAMVTGERATTPSAIGKLELHLRQEIENKFAAIAGYAMEGTGSVHVLSAVLPSVARLHKVLAAEDEHRATAAGWPRRLSKAEQAELLGGSDAQLAEILAREEAERRELEESFAMDDAWSAPPKTD